MTFKHIAVLIFVMLFTVSLTAQDRFAKVEVKTVPVAGNVYALYGSGGNIGVSAGEDGILMVDDQFAPLEKKIRAALTKLGGDTPQFLLNTHYHGDHVGGNVAFGKDSHIIAHTNIRNRLLGGTDRIGLPVITFDESLSIHFNGEEIKAIHFPNGHTDGDAVIFFTGSNVVHMGDHMFEGLFPYIDLDAGGDVEGYIDNVKVILDEVPDNVTLIPGHGKVCDKTALFKFHKMLVETTTILRNKMKAGKDLETLTKEGLPGYEEWSWSFIPTDRWIETVFNSYSK